MTGGDQSASGTEQIEVGICETCGEVESDGEFDFEYGPRCPICNNVLRRAWMEERPTEDGILSDTTADDYLGGDAR
mgnify:CR=1 FL=1